MTIPGRSDMRQGARDVLLVAMRLGAGPATDASGLGDKLGASSTVRLSALENSIKEGTSWPQAVG
jgi:hypothetical protein